MAGKDSDKLTKQIIIAIVIGIVLGLVFNKMGYGDLSGYLKPIGTIFIKFLKMMIVPLVLSSVYMAIVNLGSPEELGSMGFRAIVYYTLTTAIAAFIGLIMVNIFNPGVGLENVQALLGEVPDTVSSKVQAGADTGLWKTILGVFMDAIPTNPFAAMSSASVLQIIVFAIVFGIVSLLHRKQAEPVIKFMESLEKISMHFIHLLMLVAPIGIFALTFSVVCTTGAEALAGMGKYMLAVLMGLLAHFGVLLTIASWRHKKSPIFILKAVSPAMLTAFSTASSAATLPITMAAVEDNLGVNKKTAEFVLPLGATINMDGTALYESVAAIFIGQAFGIEMTIQTQIVIFLTASLAAVGAAAIPGAGLVTMGIVLTAVDFPLEGVALVVGVDRILDMFRTSINVFGDTVGTIVVESFDKNKNKGS